MTKSSDLVTDVLVRASQLGKRLFRRNTGLAWVGSSVVKITSRQVVTVNPGDMVIRNARPFKNGETGQSDTYGWRSVTVTSDMVGQTIAQHVEIECKFGSGRETIEQEAWGSVVKKSGGIYGVAREISDVDMILGNQPSP